MNEQESNVPRRRFLVIATSVVGSIAAVGIAAPFLMSFWPSERAKAAGAPVEVEIGKLEPGMLITVDWRGKPVWVLHRTQAMLDLLGKHDNALRDPQSEAAQQPSYARNLVRSIKPPFFVAIGICTHLGCVPTYRPDVAAADLATDWPGGFFCPCHGSKFDLAGRVFKGVPAPLNLVIPPHRYLSETRLVVGDDRAA